MALKTRQGKFCYHYTIQGHKSPATAKYGGFGEKQSRSTSAAQSESESEEAVRKAEQQNINTVIRYMSYLQIKQAEQSTSRDRHHSPKKQSKETVGNKAKPLRPWLTYHESSKQHSEQGVH